MTKPILSICIPTYNRCEYLEKTLESITNSAKFQKTDDVQIVISNNCSTDNTHELCTQYVEKYPDKIKYIKQEELIFPDIHIFKTFEYADGIFCKLNNDTCMFKYNSLDIITDYLKENVQKSCIFFLNKENQCEYDITNCKSLDDLIQKTSYECTWIGGLCIKKDVYQSLENPLQAVDLKLSQVDIYGQLLEKNYELAVWKYEFFKVQNVKNKGGSYNIAEVFGKNYFSILSEYVNKNNGISIKTIKQEKKNIIKFINRFYFDHDNIFTFNKTGYLKYMYPIYKNEPYFYRYFISNLFKIFLNKIIRIEKTKTHRKIILLGFIKINKHKKSSSKRKRISFTNDVLKYKQNTNEIQIWFDHVWGGGSESYFFDKLSKLKNNNVIIRIQNTTKETFLISYYYQRFEKNIIVPSLKEIDAFFNIINPQEIVINQLASYKNIPEILDFITKYKNKHNIHISFRGHDFQSLCPSITLLDEDGTFCGADRNKCEKCYLNRLDDSFTEIKYESIPKYQKDWLNFLKNTCDEIIVFSQSSKEIFSKFYSDIEGKITIIPHEVWTLRKVNIPKHEKINVGVLGSIITKHKGLEILKEIDQLLPKYPEFNFEIIGDCSEFSFKNISVHGKYIVSELPDIIEEKQIDVIFIPSVWPETFSYTTSEAMSMGVAVACFNLGAPAERVKNYDRGIVISDISAKCALNDILKNFKNI